MLWDELSAVQLRDGGIEIAPPRANGAGTEDGTASIILQVFNEHADKVEIEYQPASRQADTRWGFWCDGQILKAVIPYEFWKSYWYPELYPALNQEEQLQFNDATQSVESRKPSSAQPISNGSQEEPVSVDSPPAVLMAGIKICQCHTQNHEDTLKGQDSSRQVSVSFRPTQAGELVQAESNPGSSERIRVIKVNCGPPGSPATSEHFERAIKVRCPRPASPIGLYDPVSKMRCSTPTSPWSVAGTPSTPRQQFSEASEPSLESPSSMPTSTAEALARAKEALARVQRLSEAAPNTRPPSSCDSSDRLSESRCVTPSPPAEILARAKDAFSLAHTTRPSRRPAPSTPNTRPSSESAANTEVYVRCASTDVPPLQVTKTFPDSGVPRDTSDVRLTRSFSGDTSDLVDVTSRGTSCFQTGRHFNSVVVGRIILREPLKQENRVYWKTAVENFMSKEKAIFLKHGKKSKKLLKETTEFISRETDALFAQGKRYLSTKRQEWGLPNLECIFCLRVAPPSVDPDGIVHWDSLNDRKSWEKMTADSRKRISSPVTAGTNTMTCSSPSEQA